MLADTVKWYDDLIEANKDPRTEGWFMVGSPFEGITVCILYVLFVTIVGPRLMVDRKPYDIRSLMVVYNGAMVALSSYMVYLFLAGGWWGSYTFGCQLVDRSESAEAMTMVWASYLFYISKYIELIDTVFFILRKKFELVTFLHVFHHGLMPCTWWLGAKFSPGGLGTFHALCNSAVHVVMYVYYAIAAMGPQYQKYIWWKKYMTKIQMIQFIAVGIHVSQLFLTDCQYPKFFGYWIMGYSILFLILFSNFYIQAYLKRRYQAKKRQSNGSVCSNGITNAQELNHITNGSAIYVQNGSHTNGHRDRGDLVNGLKQD